MHYQNKGVTVMSAHEVTIIDDDGVERKLRQSGSPFWFECSLCGQIFDGDDAVTSCPNSASNAHSLYIYRKEKKPMPIIEVSVRGTLPPKGRVNGKL